MAKTQSALKELRKSQKRAKQNKAIMAHLKYLEKQFLKILAKDKKAAKELYIKLQQGLDKAVKTNRLKKNTASRKKSRLVKKLNK